MNAADGAAAGSSGSDDDFGAYRVVRKLGSGDFADVFLVSDGRTEYALKWAADRKGAEERLNNEIEVLRQLEHKGIPRYVEQGEKDGRPYLVMTVAKGETIHRLLGLREEADAVHGQAEVLIFLKALFDALEHLHSRGFVHRDIKSANVLASITLSSVSVIDFGFAKREGASEIRMDDSFWRAGAARYAPPEKHARPGTAVANHDIFAAGVLAYQLLTGEYPWDVPGDRDVGELRDRMLTVTPAQVADLNPRVERDVSRFVMGLIEIRDAQRPSAEVALTKVKEMLGTDGRREPAARRSSTIIAFPRVVRDPLFGDVRMTDYERLVLNTTEMQRLRYIKQLGLTNLVYPGAEHTRLSHAIGCVYRTEQMLHSIEDIYGVRIDPETRLVSRLYALIHDVTHVPFGHTIEDELGIYDRHDQNVRRIERLVLSPRSQLSQLLGSRPEGQQARAHFDREASILNRSAIAELISGSTGADVLDYIDRDAFFCGLDHRIDSALFRQLNLSSQGGDEGDRVISLLYGREGPRIDREYAVENLLAERYALFLKVYCHKRKHAASAVLDKALSSAIYGGRKGSAPEITEVEYEQLPDDVVIDRLRRSKRDAVKRAADRLFRRELPRGVFRAQLLPESSDRTDGAYSDRRLELKRRGLFQPTERLELVRNLAKAARVSARDVFVFCPPKAPGYQRVTHWLSRRPGKDEKADDLTSPLREIRSRHLGLWELWVFCADSDSAARERLALAAEEQFGLVNRISVDPRRDRLF